MLSGSTRNETPDSSRPRNFSEISTPVSQQKKSFGLLNDKAAANNTARNTSKANNGFNPSDVMNVRWLQMVQHEIPTMDFDDLNVYDHPEIKPRQFAPEFSQQAYSAMLAKDLIIGDYISGPFPLTLPSCSSFNYNSAQRE